MAKLIGHITWSCPLRRPALSLINAVYRFVHYLRTSKRTVVACGRPGIQVDRVIASAPHVQPCQSLGHHGSVLQMPRVERMGATESRVAGVTQRDAVATGRCAQWWRFSADEFISARPSALDELELEAQKASWLGVEDMREASSVDLLLLETRVKIFTQCLMIALSSKMYHRPYCRPSLPGASLFGGVWR